MKKFLLFGLFFLPLFSFAQLAVSEPDTLDATIKLIPTLLEFVKNGNYLAAGSVLTLLLVFILKKFVLPKVGLKPAILPMVSAVLGCFVGLAVAILGGAQPLQAVLAIGSGPTASLLWDAVVKFFIKKEEPVAEKSEAA